MQGLRREWYRAFRSPLLLQQRTESSDLCGTALQLVVEHGRFRLRCPPMGTRWWRVVEVRIDSTAKQLA